MTVRVATMASGGSEQPLPRSASDAADSTAASPTIRRPTPPQSAAGSERHAGRDRGRRPDVFVPAAWRADADGDFLEYTITNQPTWATFNDETGLLTGMPTDANVGESEDITITRHRRQGHALHRPVQDSRQSAAQPPPPSNQCADDLRHAADFGGGRAAVSVSAPGASMPIGDTLRFSISNRPSWATFSSTTGLLSGTPTRRQRRDVFEHRHQRQRRHGHDAAAGVLDPSARSGQSAPTISGTPATSVQAAQTYTFTPAASDPDGDTLIYSIINRPRWATFSTASGRLSGTPAATDVGTYSNVTIRVSDGRLTASLPAFAITVTAAANRAPTITGTPATSAAVGSAYSFTPTATDPDGGTLGFTIQNRPSWAAFDTATGRLSGTPTRGRHVLEHRHHCQRR